MPQRSGERGWQHLKEDQQTIVYLLSGPLGVGKSTTSRELARITEQSVLIEGDHLLDMFYGEVQPPWEERLNLAWTNIAAVTRNVIRHRFNVIIDFVVEDELDWFCEQIADLNVSVKYVVLRADQEQIVERLRIRGDMDALDRSLFLLNKLTTSPANIPFIMDTTRKTPLETAQEIIHNAGFYYRQPF
ncbi:AAA family ATPase [Paenibacillus sp. R14(2021)]|uniref:AAA family ATPase n=1 Tax=Paenibacillus sp. R14(2021) TaxID=2859228 RepID=UPI001C612D52|nr:AAA family ATPase [Paenibacillus sp. R14(2021)]